MRRLATVLTCVISWINTPAWSLSEEEWELWKLCPPESIGTQFLIEGFEAKPAKRGGLSSNRVATIAESRLRSAGLYEPDAPQFLAIKISIIEPKNGRFPAFHVLFTFWRELALPTGDGLWWHPYPVWFDTYLGTGQGSLIYDAVNQGLERFTLQYLRARDDDRCRQFRASFTQ